MLEPSNATSRTACTGDGLRIVGVDPGLHVTGYGIIDVQAAASGRTRRFRIVEAGLVRSQAQAPLTERLKSLFDGLQDVFREYGPDLAVIEELYSTYRHPRTAILMGHARGVILLAAAQSNVAVVSYGASEMKRALTGNGRASKQQIQRTVQQRLRLRAVPSPADVADALALALCHAIRTSILRCSTAGTGNTFTSCITRK